MSGDGRELIVTVPGLWLACVSWPAPYGPSTGTSSAGGYRAAGENLAFFPVELPPAQPHPPSYLPLIAIARTIVITDSNWARVVIVRAWVIKEWG